MSKDILHPHFHALNAPDKPAYIMAASGEIVTYGQLEERSNRIAHLLRRSGLGTGDSIAIFMENNARFYELCWGAQRAGLYFTPISSRLTAEEVAYIAADCGARLFFTSKALEPVISELESGGHLPKIERKFVTGGTASGYESLETALAAMPATPIADETAGTDMLYSSGTTGRPKGILVKLTGGPIGAPTGITDRGVNHYKFNEDMIYLSPAPLYHAAPLRWTMAVHRLGGTVVVMEHFDAEDYLRLVEKYRVTHSQLVPTMFVRMLKLPDETRTKYDLSSLQVAVHAAAPCPVPVKEKMIEWWGPIIYEYYSGSEGNGVCMLDTPEWLAHRGSVGKPLNAIVHICDDEGNEVPLGEEGTIYFESPVVFEYHNDPKKTAESRHPKQKGWTTLGDVGKLDQDGYVYLTDRKAFMIISGGVNIYPQEAENILFTHPKVADVAVIGVPNEDFGEEVKAIVQPMDWNDAGPALAAELIEFCRSRLSPIKCPRSVDFDPELPRAPTGKLYKRLIRDHYWGNRQSRIV